MSDLDRFFGGARDLTITVRLPDELADELEAVTSSDPGFASRLVRYGLNRRLIYQRLRDAAKLSVLLIVTTTGCRTPFGVEDPIYPDDPRYEELCVYAVPRGTDVRSWVLEHVPKTLQDRCRPVYVWVVGGSDG